MSKVTLSHLKNTAFQNFGVMICLPKNLQSKPKEQNLGIPQNTCSYSNGGTGILGAIKDYKEIACADMREELEKLALPLQDDDDYDLSFTFTLMNTIAKDMCLFISMLLKCDEDSQRNLASSETLKSLIKSIKEPLIGLGNKLTENLALVKKFIIEKNLDLSQPSRDWILLLDEVESINKFLKENWLAESK